ncbi:MAG: hypothetical protein JRM73_00630 [Nitrososphaerota archaeon]|nr:hypothetical protein [Nitrososphaerota archaeon]
MSQGNTLPLKVPREREPESRRRRNIVVLVAVVAVVLILSAFLGVLPGFGSRATTVVDSNIDVLLTACVSYQVAVPAGGSPVLQGSFQVLGGTSNQVQVLVMSAQAYSTLEHSCGVVAGSGNETFVYNSGAVNSGAFSVTLSGGATYYLVYNNPQLYNNVLTTKVVLQ